MHNDQNYHQRVEKKWRICGAASLRGGRWPQGRQFESLRRLQPFLALVLTLFHETKTMMFGNCENWLLDA